MNPGDWLVLVGIVATGATGLFLANRRTIENLVGKRLDDLHASVEKLTESTNDHGQQLVRHETILEVNGLLDRRTARDR